eukprot:746218-Hanusia_phi.AAC.3
MQVVGSWVCAELRQDSPSFPRFRRRYIYRNRYRCRANTQPPLQILPPAEIGLTTWKDHPKFSNYLESSDALALCSPPEAYKLALFGRLLRGSSSLSATSSHHIDQGEAGKLRLT